jgi:hypothetical protein
MARDIRFERGIIRQLHNGALFNRQRDEAAAFDLPFSNQLDDRSDHNRRCYNGRRSQLLDFRFEEIDGEILPASLIPHKLLDLIDTADENGTNFIATSISVADDDLRLAGFQELFCFLM